MYGRQLGDTFLIESIAQAISSSKGEGAAKEAMMVQHLWSFLSFADFSDASTMSHQIGT